ncbi:AbrB/MazE/SpoVT family DNA-binding domain-containing protein [Fulvimarina sp. 2208YS6-2-32]|uniref:AbrB/MazE/SpoVT family DNA-binding domain-containing protein n=1 Tax=Fulvimarina uroteuthidis TaxID=3098149 RepID=A0ABU5I3K4_9HYPH|nr:AbrB/MazE/SpoVT family DNA-binding domain-containing protein [Fulvimarina sp. 2208YS6-2-32]MDY8109675.1 AbrB/MazE/SpoVT family DNA-binding domain-containing protein [Fulvimarina sp. 2208YS6-2-32]
MRVTEKGQVTIPKPIRDKLGIGPGSQVEFVESEGEVHIVRSERTRDERIDATDRHFRKLHGTFDTRGLDGKAYVDWLRGPRDDIDVD